MVLPLVTGLLILVEAVFQSGILQALTAWLHEGGQAALVRQHGTNALIIGVNLGPNLSVTGSLATIRWLTPL